jgi:exodeoxyribonuclease VII small subunit
MTQKRPPTGTPESATPTFEQALARLETIVEELEGGSLSLEESIARYEEGIRLSRGLTQSLDEAEKRIERLVASENGEPTSEPMELEGESPPPAREERSSRKATRGPAGGGPDELPF